MGVRFLLGRAGAGKTHTCLQELAAALQTRAPIAPPLGHPPLIFLTPEQATFQSERALARLAPRGGLIDADVMSFKRLLRRALDARADVRILSAPARRLVLRRLAQEPTDLLPVFGAAARTPGFLDQLARFFDELISEALSPERLRTAASQLDGSTGLRVAALAELLERYQRWLGNQQLDEAAALEIVRQRIQSADWLRGARVWVDGFAGFTAQELETLVALASVAQETTIALLLDSEPEWLRDLPNDLHLFTRTRETYDLLCTRLRAAGLEFAEPLVLPARPLPRFAKSLELMRIEQALAFPLGRLSAPTDRDLAGAVRVLECESSRDEFRASARQIRREVTDSGGRVRFRDFAVIVRELEPLAELAADVFDEYDVPCFLDRRRSIAPHAIVRCVDALLAAIASDFAAADMIALLRSELVAPRAAAEQLANRIAMHEISGAGVWEKAQWSFLCTGGSPPTRRLDDVRRRLGEALLPLAERARRDTTVIEWVSALYAALQKLGVPRRIARWIDTAQQRNDIEAAETHRQAWETFCAALDDMHEWLGQTRISGDELRGLLSACLRESDVGFAPPMLDQVLIGSIERSRHPAVRHAWIVGFNDGVFPRPPAAEPVLSAAERAALAEAGVAELAAKSGNPLDERLLAYIAVTRPSETLTISYARTGSDGGALRPSPLLADVFGALPGLGAQVDSESAPETLRELGALLARGGPHAYRSECLAAERTLARDRTTAETLRRLLRGRNYENSADRAVVSLSDARQTFSMVEAQLRCPFKRFTRHGLKPEDPPQPAPLPRELGNFAHLIVAEVTRKAITCGTPVGQIENERWQAWLRQAGQAELGEIRERAAHRPQRVEAFELHLRRLEDFVLAQAARWRAGTARPVAAERELELSLVLDDATTVVVKGRADRIDLLEHDGRQYVLVYDYKSKAVKFPEADALIGEPLQALAYLLALESEGQPGGALIAPLYSDESVLNKGYVTDGSADRIRMYRFRPRGLFRTELIASLDPALTPGRHSEVVAVRMNKDGTLHAQMSKDAITGTDLNDRLAVTRAMLTSGAAGVMQGCNDISPLVVERTLACRECDFAQICRFELSYNDPRALERVVSDARREAAS